MEGRVEIVFKTYGGSKTGVSKSGSVEHNFEGTTFEDITNSLTMNDIKKVASASISIVKEIVDYEWNKYYDLTDNVVGQRNRSIAKTVLTRVSQNVGSAWSGAMTGLRIGGPIGAIVGAIAGSGINAIKQGIEIGQGYDKNRIEMDKQNAQLSYTRLALGSSLVDGERGTDR